MINKNNKRLQITVTSDDLNLLNSLCHRFNVSKTTIIKQALRVLASKRKHIYSTLLIEPSQDYSYQDEPENDSTQLKMSREDMINQLKNEDNEIIEEDD